MSYSSRVYRQRNAHTHDESKEDGFFSKKHDVEQDKEKSGSSKQGILVNEPGDSYEQEADAVANKVVHGIASASGVSGKAKGSVQRLSTSDEDERFSTNDARMKKDKEVQRTATEPEKEKDKVQKMDAPKKEEEKVQKAEAPKKEEEKVQKKEEPKKEEEKVQKKDEPKKEEEKVQKMEAPKKEEEKVQKMDEPKKEEEEKKPASVQRKPKAGGSVTPGKVTEGIRQTTGKGQNLPDKTRQEMSTGFGIDFSEVRIHTDSESVQMNEELNAQAFTNGKDIYFNEGKFNPDQSEGKFLLAHELTHVVQQEGKTKTQSPEAANNDQASVSNSSSD